MTKIIYLFEQRHGYEYDYDMFEMKFWEQSNCLIEVWSTVNWKYGDGIPIPINCTPCQGHFELV